MAITATPIFPQSIVNAATTIVNAGGTTAVSILASQTNGCGVNQINVTTTDTTANTVQLFANISSTSYLLTEISIPITSGDLTTAPTIQALSNAQFGSLPLDANGNPVLYLASGTALYAGVTTAVTSGKTLTFFVSAGAF